MLIQILPLIVAFAGPVLAVGLAAFVLTRNPRAWTNRWLAMGLSIIAAHQGFLLAARMSAFAPWQPTLLRIALGASAAIPPIWLGFGLAYGGTDTPRRSPWNLILVALTCAAVATWIVLAAGLGVQSVSSSPAGHVIIGLNLWGKLHLSVYLVGLVLVLLQLENLYRCASPKIQGTLTTMIVGIFVALACQILATSHALLYGLIHPSYPIVSGGGFFVGQVMIAAGLVRYRLLDVRVYVSRYVIYRSFTLALVGGYLLSLGGLAEVLYRLNIAFDLLTGTVLATFGAAALALLLLNQKTRWKAKGFIQAHFYTHKYDYRSEWMEFTRHLSRAATESAIAAHTAERILHVMWVQQVAIYTTSERPEEMNLLHQVGCSDLPTRLTLSPAMLHTLSDTGSRLPSATRREESSVDRQQLIDTLLPKTPVGHLVPLAALDTLVGLLVVGPELSGKPFGTDDRDLLAAVAAQAAAVMVNARLAREAVEGRELQVLVRLSAFVAHDLKNSVAMLSMLAENAPQHMHKPAFQADAVRTLSEVTAKMRKLLATLTPNPQTRIGTQRFCLASAVESWTRDLAAQIPSRIRFETRLAGVQEIVSEPEKIRSVLANLVLNAIEAIRGEGFIRIETDDAPDAAVLRVSDTGRGMSPEFIRERLFRPFQTTKPRGLGIGLYQCRHIVQACHGTLTVDSHDGQGTKMTVRLPAAPVDESDPYSQPRSSDVAPFPGDTAAPPGSDELGLADVRRKA